MKRILSMLTAALMAASTIPAVSASAGEMTPEELIKKYAEYARSEVTAHYPVCRAPVAWYEDEAGMEKCRQIEILIPREVGSNELITTTLGAYMQDLEEKYATYQESAYRGYAFTNRKSYQFYRNCCYENGFYYVLMEDGNASIVGVDTGWYNAKGGGDIDIPAQIGGTVVTRIEDYAFSQLGACLAGVKDINMPDTVETIGIGAFCGVGGQQTKIYLSQNLKAIQTLAFWGAEEQLGDEFGVITLPDSLEFLGYRVFSNTYQTVNHTGKWSYLIQMPESPVYMDHESFSGAAHYGGRKTSTYETFVAGARQCLENPEKYYTPYGWELMQLPENAGIYERHKVISQEKLAWAEKYDAKKQPQSTDFTYNGTSLRGGGMLYDRYNIVSVYDSIDYKYRRGIESDTDFHPVHFYCDGEIAIGEYDENVIPMMDESFSEKRPEYQEILRLPNTAIQQNAEENKVYGDVDCNGECNIADAILLARYIAEDNDITITEEGITAADLDADGYVTAMDQNKLLELIAHADF